MPVIKVIEVLSESPHSWEDAARAALLVASKSIRSIRSIYIENFEATVEGYEIRMFRVNAKISFELENSDTESEV